MDTSIPDYFISQLLEGRAIRNVSDKKTCQMYGSGIQDNSDNAKYTLESLVLACSLDIHGNRRNLQLATDITYILHKKLAKVSNIAPNQAVEEEEAEQEMMIDMTNMKVITVMKEKKTQVDEGDVES